MPLSKGRLVANDGWTACWSVSLNCCCCSCCCDCCCCCNWTLCICGKDCNNCCCCLCCKNFCWYNACSCDWRACKGTESCLCNSCWITCCWKISSCLTSSLGIFAIGDKLFGSWIKKADKCMALEFIWPVGMVMWEEALEAPCCWCLCGICWGFWSWFGLCWTKDAPSRTDEPEILILLEENDMGEAGSRLYDSAFILALRCKWGPPESAEFASVTKELAPTLSPEFAALFRARLMSSQTMEIQTRKLTSGQWSWRVHKRRIQLMGAQMYQGMFLFMEEDARSQWRM